MEHHNSKIYETQSKSFSRLRKLWGRFSSSASFLPVSTSISSPSSAKIGGFHAVQEFGAIVESVASLNLRPEFFIGSIFGGFSLGMITAFAENWIYSPASALYALIFLIGVDHVTGTTIALRNNKFETKKAVRIFWTLISHVGLLSLSLNLAKGSVAIYWLDESVFVPLVLVNLLSLIKNLSLLGLINNKFADILYNKIDVYKNEYITQKPTPETSQSEEGDSSSSLDA